MLCSSSWGSFLALFCPSLSNLCDLDVLFDLFPFSKIFQLKLFNSWSQSNNKLRWRYCVFELMLFLFWLCIKLGHLQNFLIQIVYFLSCPVSPFFDKCHTRGQSQGKRTVPLSVYNFDSWHLWFFVEATVLLQPHSLFHLLFPSTKIFWISSRCTLLWYWCCKKKVNCNLGLRRNSR